MYFVWGSRLFGKVDEVPGLFHVATRFGHFDYFPLIPLETHVILGQSGKTFRGVKISLSAKSIFVAYGRAISFLAAILSTIPALIFIFSPQGGDWVVFAGIAACAWSIFGLLMWYPGVRRASFNRACYIARVIQLNDAGMAIIERHYGQAAVRGFDVVAPANASAAMPPEPIYAVEDD